MAREVKPPIDAEAMIEKMRKSAVPTYHTAADCKNKSDPVSEPRAAPEPISEPQTKQKQEATRVPEKETEIKLPGYLAPATPYQGMDLVDSELRFIKTFVEPSMFVSHNGINVRIRREHREMIENLLTALNVRNGFTAYLDNVLTEHIKQYYSIMMDISRKCPDKFQ